MHCEHCDSPNVSEEVYETVELKEDNEETLYVDVIAYTCQACGYYWEEDSEPYQ